MALKRALSGRHSAVCVVGTVSPSSKDTEHSLNTLSQLAAAGARAKGTKNTQLLGRVNVAKEMMREQRGQGEGATWSRSNGNESRLAYGAVEDPRELARLRRRASRAAFRSLPPEHRALVLKARSENCRALQIERARAISSAARMSQAVGGTLARRATTQSKPLHKDRWDDGSSDEGQPRDAGPEERPLTSPHRSHLQGRTGIRGGDRAERHGLVSARRLHRERERRARLSERAEAKVPAVDEIELLTQRLGQRNLSSATRSGLEARRKRLVAKRRAEERAAARTRDRDADAEAAAARTRNRDADAEAAVPGPERSGVRLPAITAGKGAGLRAPWASELDWGTRDVVA